MAAALWAACLTTVPAGAQPGAIGTGGVRGLVRSADGLPVEGAEVSTAGMARPGESGSEGAFLLAGVPAGRVVIRARRIGFAPDSVEVTVRAGEEVVAELTLRRLAVALRPVVVTGRREVTGRMAGFYQRMSRGIGHFFTREAVERRNPGQMTDLFRMVPGARVETRGFNTSVRFRGSRCAPLVWLDGSPLYAGEFDLNSVDPRTFEGIEIYNGAASVPAEFQGNRSISSACGTIILWSRQGELRPKRRKKGEQSAAAEIAQLVQQLQVFTEDQVDRPATPDSSNLVRPLYPDELYAKLVPGRVLAEFIVDAAGEVDLDTFNVVSATHPGFVEAVRVALRSQPFLPALRQGGPVRQVVQLPFTFDPDSATPRRR